MQETWAIKTLALYEENYTIKLICMTLKSEEADFIPMEKVI